MITEIPIPILILIGITVTMGIVTATLSEIRSRQYNINAYLLWTAALLIALSAFTQEVAIAGVCVFFIAFIFVIISIPQKLDRRGKQ